MQLANGSKSHFELARRGGNASVFVAVRLRVDVVDEDQPIVETGQKLPVAAVVAHRRDGHLADSHNRRARGGVVIESGTDRGIAKGIAVPPTVAVVVNQQLASGSLRVGERQQSVPRNDYTGCLRRI